MSKLSTRSRRTRSGRKPRATALRRLLAHVELQFPISRFYPLRPTGCKVHLRYWLMGGFVHSDSAEGQRRFEELLANRFPGISAQINEVERGLLHLEMAVFARATCAAIANGDLQEVAAHLTFIDELFGEATPDLENAIYVSYLENVFLGREEEISRSARSCLSSRLAAALDDLEEHWKKIAEWSRKGLGEP